MHLSALYIYPVKSCQGVPVDSAALDELGLAGDRRFMVVDATGKFITQRTHPQMALIAAALNHRQLTLSAPSYGSITVSRASSITATVSIWKSTGLLADDCGDEPAQWFSDFLGLACRLVRVGEKFSRPNLKPAAQPGDRIAFADACPLLVISEASLTDLNERIQENQGDPVPMNRFRPNLVVSGCDAFAEDHWSQIRIGDLVLRQAGPCARCIITTTDQVSGGRTGPEPLRTLATYRRAPADPTDVNFGINLIHETKAGLLRVGMKIEIA